MAKILVVEDNVELAEQVRTALLFEHHTVESVHDGRDAFGNLRAFQYDLVILDWDLPGMSGLDICKEYRGSGGVTPILMLTGKGGIAEKESGLDAGADDYLTKPFHLKELLARTRALLRRSPQLTDNVLKAGSLTLDPKKYRVVKEGQVIFLVPKEFAILEFLMRHPNEVFAPEALLNRIWPSDSEATAEALRTAMKRLRKKVDPEGQYLRTVHGVGYILELPP